MGMGQFERDEGNEELNCASAVVNNDFWNDIINPAQYQVEINAANTHLVF